MSNLDLVVDNFTEEEKKQFPDLYKFTAEDSLFLGLDNDPFFYTSPEIHNLQSTKIRTESVEKIVREAKTSVEMLTNFLNYFTHLKSLPGCNYITGREMNPLHGCKGYSSEKIDNLYKVTTDIICFCKLRDPALFTNAETMMLLNNILYTILTFTGTYLLNTSSTAITTMVNKINTFLGKERIFYKCKNGDASYTCGRAVGYIPCTENLNEPGYILIFNTVSEDNDYQDMDYYFKNVEIINKTLCEKKPENKNTNKSTNASGAGAGVATRGGKRKIKRTRRLQKKQKRKSRKY